MTLRLEASPNSDKSLHGTKPCVSIITTCPPPCLPALPCAHCVTCPPPAHSVCEFVVTEMKVESDDHEKLEELHHKALQACTKLPESFQTVCTDMVGNEGLSVSVFVLDSFASAWVAAQLSIPLGPDSAWQGHSSPHMCTVLLLQISRGKYQRSETLN